MQHQVRRPEQSVQQFQKVKGEQLIICANIVLHSCVYSALVDDVHAALSCNTEKDWHTRLNARTAGTWIYYSDATSHFMIIGILAGMRPCGLIILLSELFTSESKSQVYGCLHNYYSHHPTMAGKIGKNTPLGMEQEYTPNLMP